MEDKLYHWKYISREKVNGKWRYTYDDSTEEDIAKQQEITDQQKVAERRAALDTKLARADRYVEAAKTWIGNRLSRSVADTFTGKDKPITWNEAKEWVDTMYRYGDEELLLTDKYRKKK